MASRRKSSQKRNYFENYRKERKHEKSHVRRLRRAVRLNPNDMGAVEALKRYAAALFMKPESFDELGSLAPHSRRLTASSMEHPARASSPTLAESHLLSNDRREVAA
jgi:hypothetical protein